MKIPSQFKLLGKTITVWRDSRLDHREGCTGMAMYRTQRILLQSSSDSHPITEEEQQQIFLHELLHHCLKSMEHELRGDEKFVNLLAGMLHQAFTTAEYNEIKEVKI